MTKKHFNSLALALHRNYTDLQRKIKQSEGLDGVMIMEIFDDVVESVCSVCLAHNLRFNKTKFLERIYFNE